MTIQKIRERINRLTQILNMLDGENSPGLIGRPRADIRAERDALAQELNERIESERERGIPEESVEDYGRPFAGADLDDAAWLGPDAREPYHWPAPRYCADCRKELPHDAPAHRRYCNRLCSARAMREARGQRRLPLHHWH